MSLPCQKGCEALGYQEEIMNLKVTCGQLKIVIGIYEKTIIGLGNLSQYPIDGDMYLKAEDILALIKDNKPEENAIDPTPDTI